MGAKPAKSAGKAPKKTPPAKAAASSKAKAASGNSAAGASKIASSLKKWVLGGSAKSETVKSGKTGSTPASAQPKGKAGVLSAPSASSKGKGTPVKAASDKSNSAKAAPAQAAVETKKPATASKGVQVKGKSRSSRSLTAYGAMTDSAMDAMCREIACESSSTTGGYCRLHYIKNWKKIKRKEVILQEGKINHYIEELVSKYPEKYIEAIRQDLLSEKDFAKVISDLDLDESSDEFEGEGEPGEGIVESIRRGDFEDEGDVF